MARTHESRLIVSLLDRVTAPARKVAASLRGLGGSMDRAGRSAPGLGVRLEAAMARNNSAIEKARGGVVDAVASFYTLKAAIGAPVQAARDFESAMADVRKVVDFPTPEGFKEFQRELLDMSKRVPITVNGLAEIAAAAGQAGIAGAELTRFTETAAQVGTAFDISADEAGEAMAKLMTGLGLTLDQATLLADSMNHLSNSQASSAAEILDVVRRVGAQGRQFGFTAEQTSAFASAMIAAGAQSEVAATSFRNMGMALTRGESATKRQSAALGRLGLDASDVARRMQDDAVGTTIDVMERLAALPKEVQAAMSNDLFGGEARALGPLLTNLDLVRASVGMVADEAAYAGSSFKEFQVRAQTFDNAVRTFSNRMHALKVVIGSALIPILSNLMETIAPVIDSMARFVEAHPQLVSKVMASVAALVALRGAMAGLRFIGLLGKGGALSVAHLAIGGIAPAIAGAAGAMAGFGGRAVAGLVAAFGRLRAATLAFSLAAGIGGAGGAIRMLGASMAAALNPMRLLRGGLALVTASAHALKIALIGTGIGAVLIAIATAGTFIYNNWSGIAEMFQSFGRAFMGALGPAKGVIDPVVSAVGRFVGWLKVLTGEVDASGESWRSWGETLGGIVGGAVARIASAIERITSLVKKANAAVRDFFTASENVPYDGRGAPSRDGAMAVDGARAAGGRVSAGGSYLVGEKGPEIISPGRSGYVHANGSGGGGGITVNVAPTLTFPGASAADADRIAREVMRRIKDETGAAMRAAYADLGLG